MAIAISKDRIGTNGLDSLGMIAACGEDCAITVVKILASGALQISHILQVNLSIRHQHVAKGQRQERKVKIAACLPADDEKQQRLARREIRGRLM